MANHVNSQLKINYATEMCETMTAAKRKIKETIESIRSQCENVRMAVTDRAYNRMLEIGEKQFEAMNNLAKGVNENVLEPATKSTIYGEAFVSAAKKTIPVLEEFQSLKLESAPYSASAIEARGLDENWTDASKAQFADSCKDFITVRHNLMMDIGEITSKNDAEDMHEVYQKLGAAFEDICNSCVDVYKAMIEELTEAGIISEKDIDEAMHASDAVKRTELAAKGASILGGEADV